MALKRAGLADWGTVWTSSVQKPTTIRLAKRPRVWVLRWQCTVGSAWRLGVRLALLTGDAIGAHLNAAKAVPPTALRITTSQGGVCHTKRRRKATLASAKSRALVMPAVQTG